MIDLFQLQTDSNDLWPRIAQAIDEAKGELETVKAERDQYKATIETFLAADEARRAELIENAVKSANQKRLDELEAEIAEDKAELARDEAERERLKSQN